MSTILPTEYPTRASRPSTYRSTRLLCTTLNSTSKNTWNSSQVRGPTTNTQRTSPKFTLTPVVTTTSLLLTRKRYLDIVREKTFILNILSSRCSKDLLTMANRHPGTIWVNLFIPRSLRHCSTTARLRKDVHYPDTIRAKTFIPSNRITMDLPVGNKSAQCTKQILTTHLNQITVDLTINI